MPTVMMLIANISKKLIVSLKINIPRINVRITDADRKIPSVRPKGFLENTYPTINLETNAKANARIMGRLVIIVIQKSPWKRLGSVLPISMFPIFSKTSPVQYKSIATDNGNQKSQRILFIWRFTSYTSRIIPDTIITIPNTWLREKFSLKKILPKIIENIAIDPKKEPAVTERGLIPNRIP